MNVLPLEELDAINPETLDQQDYEHYMYSKGFWDAQYWQQMFLPDWVTVRSPDFHGEMTTYMNQGSTLVLVPRGFGKTTVCVMRLLRALVYHDCDMPRTDPRTPPRVGRVLIWMSGALLRRTFRRLDQILTENQAIIDLYGPMKKPGGTWRSTRLELSNGAVVEGITRWGALRGGRYDEIWADDIQETHEAHAPHQADKILLQIQAGLMPSLVPGGRIIITGTNPGRESLMQRLYDTPENGFQKLWYRSVECPQWSPEGKLTGGQLLWPERFSLEFLEQQRILMGTRLWRQEYQNEPNGVERKTVFDPESVAALPTIEPIDTMRIHGVGEIFVYKKYTEIKFPIRYGIDTAAGGEDGDYQAIMGVDSAGELVLQFQARCLQSEVAEVIEHLFQAGYRGVLIPERNYALAFFDACASYTWYPQAMYRQASPSDIPGSRRPKKYGITMTAPMKRKLVEHMHRVIEQGRAVSTELKKEIEVFVYDDRGSMNALGGYHDDLLMSYMLTLC